MRIITIQAHGGSMVRCKILQCWTEPDGAKAYIVQALSTGETMTVLRRVAPPARPGQDRAAQKVEIYSWGTSKTPPRGTPWPPAKLSSNPPQTLAAAVRTRALPVVPDTNRAKVTKGAAALEGGMDGTAGELKQVAVFETTVKPGTDLQPAAGTGALPAVDSPEGVHEVEATTAADEAVLKAALQARFLAEQEAKAMATLEVRLRAAHEAKEKAELEASLRTAQEAKETAEREANQQAELVAKAKAALETSLRAQEEAKAKAEQAAKAKADLEARVKAAHAARSEAASDPVQPGNPDPRR